MDKEAPKEPEPPQEVQEKEPESPQEVPKEPINSWTGPWNYGIVLS